MLSFSPTIKSPYLTYQEYSRESGMPLGTIKDKVGKGELPVKKKKSPGEKPMINMIALTEMAAREALAFL